MPCDQAIFTSARSSTGEGYQLIAASTGLHVAEKVEITRRSPSHGGLCRQDPGAFGLMSYRLPTGRHCVAYCAYAGQEQTARGGQRVYTHAVVMSRPVWQRLQANPLPVHAAIARHVETTGPLIRPTARLEMFDVPPPAAAANLSGRASAVYTGASLEHAITAAAELLAGRSVLVRGLHGALAFLEKTLLSLPLETREGLDVSAGLKFSPVRRMHLVLTDEPEAELHRRLAGRQIWLLDVQSPAPAQTDRACFGGWLRLLRRWWQEGRRRDILRLTTDICRGVPSKGLDTIAALCEQIDGLESLSLEQVRLLMAHFGAASPSTKAEQLLVQELLARAAAKVARLETCP